MVRTSITRRLIWLRNRRPLNLIRSLFLPRLSNLYILFGFITLIMILLCYVDFGHKPSSSKNHNAVHTRRTSSKLSIFSLIGSKLWPSSVSDKKPTVPMTHKPWGTVEGSCRSSNKMSPSLTSFLDKEDEVSRRNKKKKLIMDKYHNHIDPKVLVFVETQYSLLGKQIVEVLEASRIRFKLEFASKSLPILTNLDKGKFAVIIFENLNKYLHMNKWNRELIDKYCREYSVGIIGFLLSNSKDGNNNNHSGHKHAHNNQVNNNNEVNDVQDDFDYDDNHDEHKNDGKSSIINGVTAPIQVPGFPLQMIQAKDHYQNNIRKMISSGMNVSNINTNIQQTYHIDDDSAILRILKPGTVHDSSIDKPSLIPGSEDWVLFQSNHTTYHPVTYLFTSKDAESTQVTESNSFVNVFNERESSLTKAYRDNNLITKSKNEIINEIKSTNLDDKRSVMNIVLDDGTFDGIERLIFGSSLTDYWNHKLILLDAISYLSHSKLSLSLNHYILIDIDDIFVGESGTRMKREDVNELINAQNRLSKTITGFKYNLGFSGKYYHRGTNEEDDGDDYLIENSSKFWWFCHMWSHSQPHLFNTTVLEHEMILNLDFAKDKGIPWPPPSKTGTDGNLDADHRDIGHYSIAPHHSGVYPVHEELYETWKRILNIRVTSTEEYPHLRPARLRRGYIYQGISVLPRQTCGLYTHTIFLDKYPGGRSKLINSIKGGELFYTLIYNPINIFMTHLSNYGNDRLGIFTFESVINYLTCWTNIKLQTLPPTALARKYFSKHPEEVNPVWVNPCLDKRHSMIWSSKKSCQQLPNFLIIGPQKTGTTALYTFLLMHPSISSNHQSIDTFEEVQFFNGKNYYNGLDWYMNSFPSPNSTSSQSVLNVSSSHEKTLLFEKSANYFDGDLVPLRVHSLLPNAKIITILIDPIKRAYSWYQHQRAHRDVTALNYSFYDVITSKEHSSSRSLRDLRNRCLLPGLYNQHLERWLNYYSPANILIIDGDELKSNPVNVMDQVQNFLKVTNYVDYQHKIRFDSKKGFFCSILNEKTNQTKCLGKSKGRSYEDMDTESESYLRSFFMPHNVALSKLLTRIHVNIPPWLEEELSKV